MPSEPSPGGHTAYVLKMYPRYSETFITTEILAREAAGEEIVIYSLRPPTDPRFHPELGRVAAHVHYLEPLLGDRPAPHRAARLGCGRCPAGRATRSRSEV